MLKYGSWHFKVLKLVNSKTTTFKGNTLIHTTMTSTRFYYSVVCMKEIEVLCIVQLFIAAGVDCDVV